MCEPRLQLVSGLTSLWRVGGGLARVWVEVTQTFLAADHINLV